MAITSPARSRSRERAAAVVALACTALDVAVLVVLHVAQPDVDPLTSPTSAYVHGALGPLSTVAALAVGVAALALAVAWKPSATSRAARVALVLLVVFGVTKLVQAFFPIDPVGTETTSGLVHNLAGNLAFFTLPVAAVLLGRAVQRAVGKRSPVLVSWALVAATVAVLAADAVGGFGLAQRLYLVLAAAWVAATAIARLAPESD